MAGKLNLACESKAKIGLIGSMLFLGWGITNMWLPKFADIHGRRNVFTICMLIDYVVWGGLLYAQNIYLVYALLFIYGCTVTGRKSIGYVMLVENVPKAYSVTVGNILIFMDGSLLMFVSLYFRYISKNWLYLNYFSLSVSFVFLLIWLKFSHENPRFLIAKGRLKEAYFVLKKMAKFNGCFSEFIEITNNIAFNDREE
jgi:MFS family permease